MDNEGLKILCAAFTCCGCLIDYKANFNSTKPNHVENGGVHNNEEQHCDDDKQHTNDQSRVRRKYAWIIVCWRMLVAGVELFNLAMDSIFIYGLWTDESLGNQYAYYMIAATATSFLSEVLIFRSLINMKVRKLEDWQDQIDAIFWCCVSALVSYWIEDVTTIYLYSRVDGAFDKDSLSDMMNLFASLGAGCLALAISLSIPMILFASRFGAFDRELTLGERCCQCLDCCCFVCIDMICMDDGPAFWAFFFFTLLSLFIIGITAIPVIIAFIIIWGDSTPDYFAFLFIFLLIAVSCGGVFIMYGISVLLQILCSSDDELARRKEEGPMPVLLQDSINVWLGGSHTTQEKGVMHSNRMARN